MEKYIYRYLVEHHVSRPAVLCSVVDWKGSVPRRDFPVMLVLESGESIGTVGGGAMEYQVIELAKSVFKTGQPVRKRFDMTGSSTDSEKSLCGGKTQVLVEPYTKNLREMWRSLNMLEHPQPQQMLITISGYQPAETGHWLINSSNETDFSDSVVRLIRQSREQARSLTLESGDELNFIHYIASHPRLHIFGTGHIGQAVAQLAHFIELDTLIYDDRPELTTRERFPQAVSVNVGSVSELQNSAEIYPDDYALIVSHGHRNDFALMKWLLNEKIAWLGLLSSQRKWKILSQSLIDEGFTPEQIQSVHAPVGMDIGSETVPEIAVSITAELIHHYRNGIRSNQSLSAKVETHETDIV